MKKLTQKAINGSTTTPGKENDELRRNAMLGLSALKGQLKAVDVKLVEKMVKGEKKLFVKVADKNGENFFEVAKSRVGSVVKPLVKIAGMLFALSAIGCVSTQTLTPVDIQQELNNPKRVESTAVPDASAGKFAQSVAARETTAATISNTGVNEKTLKDMAKNDINSARNRNAANAMDIARRVAQTPTDTRAEEALNAAWTEIFAALAAIESGSKNPVAGTGYNRGDNQALESWYTHCRQTGKNPKDFVEGTTFVTEELFITPVTKDVETACASYPQIVQRFKSNLNKMRVYAANPANAQNATKRAECEKAIDEIAELLSLAYDFDNDLMKDLFTVTGDVWNLNRTVVRLEQQSVITASTRTETATQPTKETSGHGPSGTYTTTNGSSGSGNGVTPSNPEPPAPPQNPGKFGGRTTGGGGRRGNPGTGTDVSVTPGGNGVSGDGVTSSPAGSGDIAPGGQITNGTTGTGRGQTAGTVTGNGGSVTVSGNSGTGTGNSGVTSSPAGDGGTTTGSSTQSSGSFGGKTMGGGISQ
jgi:hypothetical protein